ncbi:shikimate dehydrogenase [Phenylobacterium sp.]|uniref:shikimate dehydrogenase n=1 Tax=Phenylobacterium sp. TaxID=1871053 RepID=UPI00286E1716|nr:shikimate dehydrogenase [Phenylobacterium sp.]
MTRITGATVVAGVVGHPIAHSMSPILHNAWLAAAGIDGVYVPFDVTPENFPSFIKGLRGGSRAGLNVTLPIKTQALALADEVSERARLAQAANVLVFGPEARILADNTDGLGLLTAFAVQAPGFDPAAAPVAILGAGGAARGAAAAFLSAGARDIRVINRTVARAEEISSDLGGCVRAYGLDQAGLAFAGVGALINATSAGLSGAGVLDVPIAATPATAVLMDMVYKPLLTPFLAQAQALNRPTVDGLEMLIGQAIPAFHAFFGQPPPESVDVRTLAKQALGL